MSSQSMYQSGIIYFFKITSLYTVKEGWAELLEVKRPLSVRLLQVLCSKCCVASVDVGARVTEISAECKFILQ